MPPREIDTLVARGIHTTLKVEEMDRPQGGGFGPCSSGAIMGERWQAVAGGGEGGSRL